jgi:hypothetical protein
MDVPVNYLAVLVATLISMVIGSVWYGPLFGKIWMKEMKLDMPKKMTAKIKQEMMKSYGLMFVGSFFMAYILAHNSVFAGAYMQTTGTSAGMSSGFWNWLGFVAPVTLTAVLWEGKSWKMWCINNGYYLITMPIMGAIVAGWR